jgi:hypothetical protein
MNTLTAHDPDLTLHSPLPRGPRRSIGATLVAGLYVLLLLSSPFIVRFAPDPDQAVVVAASDVGMPIDPPRCAAAPEFGQPCDLAARVGGKQAKALPIRHAE